MPSKKSWAEIKATKPVEEWKRKNKLYALRFEMKQELKRKGVELMNKIQNAIPVGQKGVRDSLIMQVGMAINLQHGWNQQNYDHAVIMLKAVETKFRKMMKRKIPANSPLSNTLLMVMDIAGGTEKEKMAALEQVIEHSAQKFAMENVNEMEKNLLNFLITLIRQPDGHYPKWYVDKLAETAINSLLQDDLKKLASKLTDYIKDMEFFNKSLCGVDDDLGEDAIVF